MSAMFRSLAVRDYRIWFIGALVSNIGAWMQATAQNWVVLTELTANDALAVGITMALQFGPSSCSCPSPASSPTGSTDARFFCSPSRR